MATLTVTGLDPAIVRRLEKRAAEEGVPAQDLHRRILAQALAAEPRAGDRPPTTQDLIDVLREMGRLGLRIDMEDRGAGPDRPPLEM